MRRLSVAVVQGGPSSEAEVSRASAQGVAQALAVAGHGAVRLELDAFVGESLRTGGYEVVFPVAHGAVGEDGSLQGLLEVLEIPYVGSEVLASALAMHKRMARVVFEAAGLPVARGIIAARPAGPRRGRVSAPPGEEGADPSAAARAEAERARREVGARLVIKPSSHGSAIGVVRIDESASTEAVARAIDSVWRIDRYAVIEHFARGREVTCGVLAVDALGEPKALPPTEVVSPHDAFYSYEARYAPGRSVHVCPAKLPLVVTERVQRAAVDAHRALGCRDLSRVDFVVGDEGHPEAVTLLEVNTLPGMTATSLYPEAAAAIGYTMPELCSALVAHAFERGPSPRASARPLPR